MQPPPNPPDPLIGTLVAGRYRVLKPLGEGGMGQVYLAVHEAIEKQVAVKVLRREYSEKPDIVARFQQEAVSASRIKHPNVLNVFDFGQLDNGCFFLAMEFLEGNDLADELTRHRLIDPQRGVRIALQICRALAAAHSRGVVHRDMKPENVFLQRFGDGEEIIKIVDFGIAQLRSTEEAAASQPKRRRLTRTGMIFGTPEYMAPEQAAGKNADLRVDVYATGIILYEMFTGAVPFTGETFMAVLAAHLNEPTPPMTSLCPDLQISTEMQQVILRALLKDPDQRFQSMGELSSAIIATPEGSSIGRMGSIPDAPAQQFAAAGAAMNASPVASGTPTSAQFSSSHQGTAAQFPSAGPPPPSAESEPLPLQNRVSGAPVQTRLDASGSIPGVPRRSRLGLVLTLLVLVGGGGAAAFVFLKPRLLPPPPPPVPTASAVPASSHAAPPASAAAGDVRHATRAGQRLRSVETGRRPAARGDNAAGRPAQGERLPGLRQDSVRCRCQAQPDACARGIARRHARQSQGARAERPDREDRADRSAPRPTETHGPQDVRGHGGRSQDPAPLQVARARQLPPRSRRLTWRRPHG